MLIRGNTVLSLIIKSESRLIQKTNIPHALRNWQILYYVQEIDYKHWAAILCQLECKFNLNKLQNSSILFERQSVISIQLFFNVMGWEWQGKHFTKLKMFYLCQNFIFLLIVKSDKKQPKITNFDFTICQPTGTTSRKGFSSQ